MTTQGTPPPKSVRDMTPDEYRAAKAAAVRAASSPAAGPGALPDARDLSGPEFERVKADVLKVRNSHRQNQIFGRTR